MLAARPWCKVWRARFSLRDSSRPTVNIPYSPRLSSTASPHAEHVEQ
jgi:hypothetical protein